jgi:signal peptidase I
MDSKQSFTRRLGALLFEILETIVVAMAIFVVLYYFLVQPHQVTGSSMLPNFEDKDYILTDKIHYRFSQPQRGDVIVFKSPNNPSKDFIKRIIALPRERVEINQGYIYVNGEVLYESYLPADFRTTGRDLFPDGEEVVVPRGEFFVLGDNRSHSSDSRKFGTITKETIIGRAWLRYWPLNKFSLIPSAVYADH